MNITINQSIQNQESSNSDLITKLVRQKSLNSVVNLTGNIYIPAAYSNDIQQFIQYFSLTEDENSPGTYRSQDLILSVGTEYLSFVDSYIEAALTAQGVGENGHITLSQARNANLAKFQNNVNITQFPEFKYFTKANTVNPPTQMFKGCTNLVSIDLSQATLIPQEGFSLSGLTSLSTPSLTSMGQSAFYDCDSLVEVTNLGSVSQIPQQAFDRCSSLESVVLPPSCNSTALAAFRDCPSLYDINLSNLISIGEASFKGCALTGKNVSDITNVQSLGSEAFSSTGLQGQLNLPNLISCSHLAFFDCRQITKVLCLGTIASIPNYMFEMCADSVGLTEAYLPYECNTIGQQAFRRNTLLTTVKQYNKTISEYAEGETPTYSNLSRIVEIQARAFFDCRTLVLNLQDLTSLSIIGENAFYNCKLLSGTVNLPNLTSLGKLAFEDTAISSVTSLGSVANVPDTCFKNCKNLTSFSVSNNNITYSSGAFYGCENLTTVSPFPSTINSFLFTGCTKLQGTLPANLTISGHKGLTDCTTLQFTGNHLYINPTDGIIGYQFFRNCNIPEEITINSSVEYIYCDAFINCQNLRTIHGLENIKYIGRSIFDGCINLEGEIDLSGVLGQVPTNRVDNAEQFWGEGGFVNCSKITRIKLGDLPCLSRANHAFTQQNIVFKNCTSLHTVDIKSLGEVGKRLNTNTVWTEFDCGNNNGNPAMLNFVLRQETVPPTTNANKLSRKLFGGPNVTIYVPDNSVDAYKAAWANVAAYIEPLSTYVPINS